MRSAKKTSTKKKDATDKLSDGVKQLTVKGTVMTTPYLLCERNTVHIAVVNIFLCSREGTNLDNMSCSVWPRCDW